MTPVSRGKIRKEEIHKHPSKTAKKNSKSCLSKLAWDTPNPHGVYSQQEFLPLQLLLKVIFLWAAFFIPTDSFDETFVTPMPEISFPIALTRARDWPINKIPKLVLSTQEKHHLPQTPLWFKGIGHSTMRKFGNIRNKGRTERGRKRSGVQFYKGKEDAIFRLGGINTSFISYKLL